MDDAEEQKDQSNVIGVADKKRLRNVKSVAIKEKNESQLLSLNPANNKGQSTR